MKRPPGLSVSLGTAYEAAALHVPAYLDAEKEPIICDRFPPPVLSKRVFAFPEPGVPKLIGSLSLRSPFTLPSQQELSDPPPCLVPCPGITDRPPRLDVGYSSKELELRNLASMLALGRPAHKARRLTRLGEGPRLAAY